MRESDAAPAGQDVESSRAPCSSAQVGAGAAGGLDGAPSKRTGSRRQHAAQAITHQTDHNFMGRTLAHARRLVRGNEIGGAAIRRARPLLCGSRQRHVERLLSSLDSLS